MYNQSTSFAEKFNLPSDFIIKQFFMACNFFKLSQNHRKKGYHII